jgi:hypothetical protein
MSFGAPFYLPTNLARPTFLVAIRAVIKADIYFLDFSESTGTTISTLDIKKCLGTAAFSTNPKREKFLSHLYFIFSSIMESIGTIYLPYW